jgi:hypothetical protein
MDLDILVVIIVASICIIIVFLYYIYSTLYGSLHKKNIVVITNTRGPQAQAYLEGILAGNNPTAPTYRNNSATQPTSTSTTKPLYYPNPEAFGFISKRRNNKLNRTLSGKKKE